MNDVIKRTWREAIVLHLESEAPLENIMKEVELLVDQNERARRSSKVISSDNYQDLTERTENRDFETISRRLRDHRTLRLLHAMVGMVTEVGEFADILKRHIYYGKEIDVTHLKEELGDEEYYSAMAHNAISTRLNETMSMNIAKLAKRYGSKFTEGAALNRDTKAERAVLEEGSIDGNPAETE